MFSWLKTDLSKLNIVATYDLVYNAAQFVKKGFGYVIALQISSSIQPGTSNLCFKPLFLLWKQNFALYGKIPDSFKSLQYFSPTIAARTGKSVADLYILIFALRGFKLDIRGGFKSTYGGSNPSTSSLKLCYNPKIIKASGHTQCTESPLFLRFSDILFIPFVSIKQSFISANP